MMHQIKMTLSDAAMDKIQNCESREARGKVLIAMIDEKINALQEWARTNLGDEFVKFEVAAIRTFLYRELTGELVGDTDIMSLPRVKLEEHPASAI